MDSLHSVDFLTHWFARSPPEKPMLPEEMEPEDGGDGGGQLLVRASEQVLKIDYFGTSAGEMGLPRLVSRGMDVR